MVFSNTELYISTTQQTGLSKQILNFSHLDDIKIYQYISNDCFHLTLNLKKKYGYVYVFSIVSSGSIYIASEF